MTRLDSLVARHEDSQHPLTLGLLHEARARIAYKAGRKRDYHFSLTQVERHFRATGTPLLIAKSERLAELHHQPDTARQRPVAFLREDGSAVETVEQPHRAGLAELSPSVDSEQSALRNK
jgi:hypothetical protein